jgi:hypothetical protein
MLSKQVHLFKISDQKRIFRTNRRKQGGDTVTRPTILLNTSYLLLLKEFDV